MRSLSVAAGVLFLVAFLTSCNSAELKHDVAAAKKPSPIQAPPSDGVRRITVHELQDLLAKDQAVVVDVRNQASYDQGHIKGAKLIPSTEIQNHLKELPKYKTIVTYCS